MSDAIFRVHVGPSGQEMHAGDFPSYHEAKMFCQGLRNSARRTVIKIIPGKGAVGGEVLAAKSGKRQKCFGDLSDNHMTRA